jgi:hypothetical protein
MKSVLVLLNFRLPIYRFGGNAVLLLMLLVSTRCVAQSSKWEIRNGGAQEPSLTLVEYQEPRQHDTLNDPDRCLDLSHKMDAYGGAAYQMAYDTGRCYLLTCPDLQDVGTTFSQVSSYNLQRGTLPEYSVEYREWLKSVMYYQTSDYWYCGDVSSLLTTFNYFEGRGTSVDVGGQLAVARFLLSTGRCRRDSVYLESVIRNARNYQIKHWRDTVRDSIHYPNPDTTVPTLEELGLGLLRGQNAVYVGRTNGSKLSGARATQNPFESSTGIEFETGDFSLVKLEIFDELGNLVGGNLIGQVLEPGSHRFEFNGSNLPRGTYYARLSCPSGERQTVTLLHR